MGASQTRYTAEFRAEAVKLPPSLRRPVGAALT